MSLKIIPDEIFQLKSEFESDPRKDKINGGIGVYLDEQGNPFVLPIVKKAIKCLKFDNFNYLSLSGDPAFLKETVRTILGGDLFSDMNDVIAKQGVMGGTNGLYIWAKFIKQLNRRPKIVIGSPTWENHERIFTHFGFSIIRHNHLDKDANFNLESFSKALKKHPKTEVLFHAGPTHNPTGINPSKSQWLQLVQLIKEYRNKVLFDFAYMGLGQNIDKDSFPVRLFIEKKIPTSVVISYSKNMTLYQHRTGALLLLGKSKKEKELIEEHLKYLFRIVNTSPAAFGELIAKTILESRELKQDWIRALKQIVNSLKKRRELFVEYTSGQFDFVKDGWGLFSLLGLNQSQIKILKRKYGIYLLSNSRINFGGLSLKSIPKAAKAILRVSRE